MKRFSFFLRKLNKWQFRLDGATPVYEDGAGYEVVNRDHSHKKKTS